MPETTAPEAALGCGQKRGARAPETPFQQRRPCCPQTCLIPAREATLAVAGFEARFSRVTQRRPSATLAGWAPGA